MVSFIEFEKEIKNSHNMANVVPIEATSIFNSGFLQYLPDVSL